jgi:hypothetical protein
VRLVLFLTLLLTPLAAQVTHAEEWTTYTDKEAGFSVSYPADWEITTKPMPRAKIRMEAPGGEAPTRCAFYYERQDGFELMSSSALLEGHLSADLFSEVYGAKYDDIVVTKTQKGSWAGQDAAFMEASYLTHPREDRVATPYLSRFAFTPGPAGMYGSRCVVPQSDLGAWDRVIHQIVSSFRILKGGG